MAEIETISWQHLPGNKYSKALHSAMASEAGYVTLQRVRGKSESRGRFCNVCYDNDYLLKILVRKVIQPLSALGEERLNKLIETAWELNCQESIISEPSTLDSN